MRKLFSYCSYSRYVVIVQKKGMKAGHSREVIKLKNVIIWEIDEVELILKEGNKGETKED